MGTYREAARLLIHLLERKHTMPSIKDRFGNARSTKENTEIRTLLTSIQADLTALRTAHNTLATKLDNDAGVTDTNYNSLCGVGTLSTQP